MAVSEDIQSYDEIVGSLIDQRDRVKDHNWIAGDLVLQFMRMTEDKKALRKLAGETGLQYLTLAQQARVAKAFLEEQDRVAYDLPWASYRAVCHLPINDARGWLQRASDEGWNTARLQRELKGLPEPTICECDKCSKIHVKGLTPDEVDEFSGEALSQPALAI